MKRCALVLLFVVCTESPLPAQGNKRPITVEDMWQCQRMGAPAISPDGKWVAVEVTTFSMANNDSDSDLWLLSTDGKTQRQLTTAKGKDSGPAWSPDGTLAFISKRGGDVAQIHLISPEGGEAKQLSHLPMAPSGLKWSADGKTLFCIVQTWPDTPDDASFKKKEKARKDDKVQAYVIDGAAYRYWDHWVADGKKPVVFSIDAATGKHRNLFAHTKLSLPLFAPSASQYDIAPDGKEICFTADSAKDFGKDFNADLYVMPLEPAGEPKLLNIENPAAPRLITKDNAADDTNPVYSPDGTYIAFLRQTIKNFYADRERVMLYNRKKGKVEVEVTKDLDRSCSSLNWIAGKEPALLFQVEDKGYFRLYRADTSKEGWDLHPITGTYSDTAPAVSRNGKMVAFLRSSFDFPAQMMAMEISDEYQPLRIDRFNMELRRQWDLGATKDVYYKGANDAEVQMWIVYPPKFDPKKKYPLLMMVHGGPHNAIPTDFHYRWNFHVLASKGYVVACPNFHGSSAFGQKFCDSITGDMATLPFIDIMKATDYMEAQPYIDKDRTVGAGASYGGYMMCWMNGHTDRYKAMVCHAGVYNFHSMMASDIVAGRERRLGALPWQNLDKVDKQTPQRFAKNFKTPTLVIHGEKDYRVPVTQGFEYYNTLRLKGVPTRLIYFPDENHWIMKPQNSRLWHREFFAWLEKHGGQTEEGKQKGDTEPGTK
jgi:dipeptidyl aminopeptidase/acylaminoacyl peptidase